jgi:hypothetical protein
LKRGRKETRKALAAGPIDDPGQPELDDEAVLERPPQPLDPTLGLGGAGDDRTDPELDEGPPELAERLRLVALGQAREGRGEGAVTIVVEGGRQAVGLDRRPEDLEIGGRVLLVAKRRRRDDPGRVVDRPDEGQPRPPTLEPVVTAAVELEQEARGRHPLPPAAMLGRSPAPGRGDPVRAQDLAQGLAAHGDALPFGEEFAKVGVVDVDVARPAQLDDPRPEWTHETSS